MSLLETDIFAYQFYRTCLPRYHRSPGIATVRDFLRARDTREEGGGREKADDWRRAQSELLTKDSLGAHFPSP